MKPPVLVSLLFAVGCFLTLAACVGTGGENASLVNKYSTSCMFEVNPLGSYVWSDSDSAVKPGGGGTAEGAAAMNACIQRKAAAAGETAATVQAGQQSQVVEVQRSGKQVVETYTYGQPPAVTSPKAVAREGEKCRARNVLSGGAGYHGCVR